MKKLSAEKQFGFLASILSLLLMLFFYSRGSEIYFWLFFVFAITLSSLTLFAPKRLIVLSNLWMRLGLNLSILINPSVKPFRDLESEINSEKKWELEALNIKPFTRDHHLEIQKLEETVGTTLRFPDNILLVAAKGDELLSWKEMSSFYKGCQQYIVDGSDHSMTNFPKHWETIKGFIGA